MALDLTKPVQTRDGRKVRVICTDVVPSHGNFSSGHTVVALIHKDEGGEVVYTFFPNGRIYSDYEMPFDLVQAPDPLVVAAAPQMLEALEAAVDYDRTFEDRDKIVREAIAAAKGHKLPTTTFYKTINGDTNGTAGQHKRQAQSSVNG